MAEHGQRLIDANALMEELEAIQDANYMSVCTSEDECRGKRWATGRAINAVKDAPAINAVVLPCKVGDQVWHVDFDECGNACDVVGDIFVAANDEIVLCAPRPYDFHGGISQYIFEESVADEHCVELYVCERDNCYATPTEAKAALAERRTDNATD